MEITQRRRFSEIVINRIAILQYILIYIIVQYIGGRVSSFLGSDILYAGTLVLCTALMFTMPQQLSLKKNFLCFIIVLGGSLLLTFVITGGDLSLGTILSILSRFILVYVAIRIDIDNFLDRFLKLVFFLACISLVLFFCAQIAGEESALGFFSRLYEIKNAYAYLGSSYGLFLICYNFMDFTRNAYMFGEPGEYQILLIAALYFMTFFDNSLAKRQKAVFYAVYIITLLTVQSTTGYLNLIALVVAIFFMKRNQVPPFAKKLFFFVFVVLIFYLIFGYSEDSFLYKNFVFKIMSDDNTIDLAANTGAARIGSIERFVETIITVPQKLVFGVGFEGLKNTPMRGFSTDGIINSIVMIGIFSIVIMYGKMFFELAKYSKSWLQVIVALFIVVNMGLSQPDILSVISVLICMYGEFSGTSGTNATKRLSDTD